MYRARSRLPELGIRMLWLVRQGGQPLPLHGGPTNGAQVRLRIEPFGAYFDYC